MTRPAPPAACGLEARVQLVKGALHLDVSLSVGMDEVVALVGPNGAGKTTLLRALAGLEPLLGGRVVLAGQVLEDRAAGVRVAPHERPVGVVFQDYLLFPHLSALDNVAFGLRNRGRRRSEARQLALGWLERMGLAARADARPHELSGGEAQRVALARALVVEPRLLMLDEPLTALDRQARVEVRSQLRRQLAAFPGVRLLVTHDPVDAISLADRLVVVEEGRVVQSGSLTDITTRPRSRYVAELVGVNLFEGEARGDHVALAGKSRLVAAGAGQGKVFALVHPSAVSLHRRAPEGTPRNVWPATIEELDFEADRVRVRLAGAVPIVAEVTQAAASELALADGGEVWVSLKASAVSVYPV
ncbi:MAG: ABC transporter ATP-binding protein [Actinobacteria bacterium]|nr:ABC transporter ATP-binding protein [Actinomycetota bacterium]